MVVNKQRMKKQRRMLMTWSNAWGEEGKNIYDEEEKQRERLIAEADLDRQKLEEEEDAAVERTIEMWGAQRVL